ncbi:hypothetical protein DSC47_11265 [Elizabethkingia miricola]|nr:hypothetical protein BAY13_06465 [Elizabethkingia bruuniana]RBI91852.1 hypothetical protein DSC47_11265 [Elizabethkingia miricola]
MAFIGDRFKNAVINNAETSPEILKLTIGYIVYVILYSLPLIAIFYFPLYHILKIKKGIYFILFIILFFILEYYIYTYFYSPSDKIIGFYNIIIGIFVVGICFFKNIQSKFTGV